MTIIGFLALNNTAAKVWKALFEDVFLRLKLKRLVHGPLAVLFWLSMTILWMLVLALAMQKYKTNRIGEGFSLSDAYWFSYITITTVGFGDIHISHEEFLAGDMFFIPLLVLMGFNFLGIFAEKGVDLYNDFFPAKSGLEKILAGHRRRDKSRRLDESSYPDTRAHGKEINSHQTGQREVCKFCQCPREDICEPFACIVEC